MSNHVRSFTLLRLFIIIVLFSIYFLFVCTASADTLSLPNSLEIIEDEAFYSDSSLDEVIVPDGTTTIKSKAFAYSGLQEISLPRSLSFIAEDAFEGCQEFSVKVPMNCYAYTWCMNHGYISAPDPTPAEDFEWQTINGLEVKITKYIGSDADVIIPEIIDDYDVAEIDQNAFKGNTTIMYVYIPGSVRTVGSHAFQNCTNLSDIGFTYGLVDIGAEAFAKCTSLSYADLPDSLEGIGEGAFRECVNLEGFHYPASLDHRNSLYDNGHLYDGNIFRDCNKLTTYTIPEGTTTVCEGLFYGANKLQNISLPSTLKEIGSNSFRGCVSLESIVLPDGVVTIHDYAFASCTTITMLNMPNTIKTIESHAFMDCSALTSIAFSDHLLDIGAEGFANCSALTAAELPDSLVGLGEGAFSNCVNMVSIHYPLSLDHRNSLYDNGFLYDGKTFYNCQKLRSVTIPEGVTKVADGIFMGANYLREVNLPSTLTTIEANAFSGCESIRSITIPVTVTTIGNSAFEGCTALRNITLPNNIISLGAYAFKSCTALSAVTFPTGLRSLGAGVFEECTALLAANLPDSVEGLGERAFYGCKKLSSFHYPLNLDHLVSLYDNGNFYEGNVFYNCNALKTIEIPSGVSKIPGALFAGSNYLETVIVPDTVTTIGGQGLWWSNGQSFKDCVAMEKIYIGPNVTTIGDDTFAGCTNLTVWCEYGSAVLQHCIDNNVPYYYLTPTGINNPHGTLYKGDSYGLRGYAHASIELTEITATIWDSTKENILQQITAVPEELDYAISGRINSNLRFGSLPLGSYHYTLIAKTALSEEQWADTSFTIVPPPLRIFIQNLSLPSGLIRAGESTSISGTIICNYSITSVTIKIIDNADGTIARSFNSTPNQLEYALAAANASLNLSALPYSNYSIQIIAVSNGETKTLWSSDFDPVNYSGSIDDETISTLIAYAADGDHRNVFTKSYAEQVIDDMSWVEYGIVIVDNIANLNIFKAALKKLHTGSGDQSDELIDLYKMEILALLDDGAYDGATPIQSLKSDWKTILNSIKDGTSVYKELVKNNKMKFGIDICKSIVKGLKKGLDYGADIEEGINNLGACMSNAEEKLIILENLKQSAEFAGIPEFETAVDIVTEEYACWVNASLQELEDVFIDVVTDYSSEKLEDAVNMLYEFSHNGAKSSLSSFGKFQLGLKIGQRITGLGEEAKKFKSFFIQYNILIGGIKEYQTAFDIVHNGDTSTDAINRLYVAGNTAKSEWIRLHKTICSLPRYAYTIGNAALDYWDANLRNTMPFVSNVSFGN